MVRKRTTKWFQQAIKRPGKLLDALERKTSQIIAEARLKRAARGRGLKAKRAQLTLTVRRMLHH